MTDATTDLLVEVDATGVRLTSTFPANLSLFAVISGPGNLVFCCAQSYQRDIE